MKVIKCVFRCSDYTFVIYGIFKITRITASQVKNVILESGVTIDQKVIKPGTDNEMVPFSELCKSGKILNVYNAMKMAAVNNY